jgi:hypothetical protein
VILECPSGALLHLERLQKRRCSIQSLGFSSSNVMQLNAVRYLRGIRQIEFKAVIRRNPIKCLLCVKRA